MTETTFLFTDVEGSTRLWEENRDAMHAIAARHDALVEDVITRCGGVVVANRAEGDSAFATFVDAVDAIRASIDLQRAVSTEPWEGGHAIRVRMALHTGAVGERAEQAYGPVVNRCARLRGVAHGGQIVVSAATASAVSGRLPVGIGLRDLGTHALRDLAVAEQVYQVCHPDLPDDFPPLRSVTGRRHNLPVFHSAFIGRDDVAAAIEAAIAVSRLVTVTGAGGIGKTRAAVDAAGRFLRQSESSVWFVDLTSLTTPTHVVAAVADALRAAPPPGGPVVDAIVRAIGTAATMLVVDNCEHVIDGVAALVPDLLAGCASLRIVCTSREPLAITGEHVVRLDRMRADQARALFDARTTQLGGETADPATADALCDAVDRIPLAVEVAAAAAVQMGAVAALAGLSSWLADRSASDHPAHSTVRGTIEWSHELLTPEEQIVFRRMAVFAGGCDLDAVEAVCADGHLEPEDVIDPLARLIDKSLLQSDRSGAFARYRMFESVREFAHEALDRAGEVDQAADRHLHYFTNAALAAAPRVRAGAAEAIDHFALEEDNLRVALMRADSTGDWTQLANLALTLFRFWDTRGHWTEASTWLDRVVDVAPAEATRAEALNGAAFVCERLGDDHGAWSRRQEALALWREQLHAAQSNRPPDEATLRQARLGIAGMLSDLGHMSSRAGRMEEAEQLVSEALATRRLIGGRVGIAISLNHLGLIHHQRGDAPAALECFSEAAELLRSVDDHLSLAQTLNNIGSIAVGLGEVERARTAFDESLDRFRKAGDRRGVAQTLNNLGQLARATGGERARSYCSEALAVYDELGDLRGAAYVVHELGEIAMAEGDPAMASTLFERSIGALRMVDDRWAEAQVLLSLASAREALHDRAGAEIHRDASRALHDELGLTFR